MQSERTIAAETIGRLRLCECSHQNGALGNLDTVVFGIRRLENNCFDRGAFFSLRSIGRCSERTEFECRFSFSGNQGRNGL